MGKDKTESSSGYHFLNLYQSCRWRWYLKYIKRWRPLKSSRYLLFGAAIHEAKEAFYTAGLADRMMGLDEFVAIGLHEIRIRQDDYDKPDAFDDDMARAPAMLRAFYETYGPRDFEEYDILEIEKEHHVHLPGNYILTVRPDAVVRRRLDGLVICFETKTTSRSVSEMAKSVACQQQVDAQSMAIIDAYGEKNFGGIQPDILYQRQSVVRAERTPPILRSRKELADTKLAFSGIFQELGAKVKGITEGGMPPEMLFDRNGAWCAQFGCEYADVCHGKYSTTPPGFVEAPK